MRRWISDKDHRWVMECDVPGCGKWSEPEARQPDLEELARAGWFIASLSGDRCPSCFKAEYPRRIRPHMVMQRVHLPASGVGGGRPTGTDNEGGQR